MTTTTIAEAPTKPSFKYRLLIGVLRFLFTIFFKVDARGLERTPMSGPLLACGNHTRLWEGPLVLAYLPRRPLSALAKLEYKGTLIGNFILEPIDVVYVNRGEVDRTALKELLKRLKAGYAVGIAPEGTRSTDSKMRKGKEGTAYLALQTGAQVLPVAIWGHENFPASLKRLRRCPVNMRVGYPFVLQSDPTLSRQENMERGTEEIMVAIARMLPPEYRGYYSDKVLGPPVWEE
jgi:1-acyl-sn-glycerol-3-phosphate acyltransferase